MPPVRLIAAAAVMREVPYSNPRQGVQCAQRTLVKWVGFWVATGAGGHGLPPSSHRARRPAAMSTSPPNGLSVQIEDPLQNPARAPRRPLLQLGPQPGPTSPPPPVPA